MCVVMRSLNFKFACAACFVLLDKFEEGFSMQLVPGLILNVRSASASLFKVI